MESIWRIRNGENTFEMSYNISSILWSCWTLQYQLHTMKLLDITISSGEREVSDEASPCLLITSWVTVNFLVRTYLQEEAQLATLTAHCNLSNKLESSLHSFPPVNYLKYLWYLWNLSGNPLTLIINITVYLHQQVERWRYQLFKMWYVQVSVVIFLFQ